MMGAGGMIFIGSVWFVIWTINSILVGILLWRLIQRYTKR